MLARTVASADYVSSKLSFGWKSFRFSMARDSNIADDVTHLADSVFTDIARQAADAYRNIFADKEQITRRALGPLKAMESKLAGLAFLEPRVGHAAGLIHIEDEGLGRGFTQRPRRLPKLARRFTSPRTAHAIAGFFPFLRIYLPSLSTSSVVSSSTVLLSKRSSR